MGACVYTLVYMRDTYYVLCTHLMYVCIVHEYKYSTSKYVYLCTHTHTHTALNQLLQCDTFSKDPQIIEEATK